MKSFVLSRLFYTIPLRQKLMAIMLITSGIVVSMAVSALIVNEALTFRRSIREELLSLADIVGQNAAAAVVFNDKEAANATLVGLHANPRIVGAYIFGPDDRLFAVYPYQASDGIPGTMAEAVGEERPVNILQDWLVGFHVAKKIVVDGKNIGTVIIKSDMAELNQKLWLFLGVVAVIILASSLIAYLLARWLQGLISGPIVALATVMKQVTTEKNYAVRATATSKDEIGSLIDGFNEMLMEMDARDEILRQRQDNLQRLAHFDTLTRLPNRALFADRLTQGLRLAERAHQKIAVMFIDLDHFKDINDTLGHALGDILLQVVAERLLGIVRSCDTVARMGGDEFTLFLQDLKADENAGLVAQKINAELSAPYLIEGKEIFVTASIGIAIYPDDGGTLDELLSNADTAMYQTKESGKNGYKFYTMDMNIRARKRLEMQKDLRHAMERGEMELYYQPKVAVETGRVTGLEALLRWNHPEQGLILPEQFIRVAEETGLIVPLGEWVLRSACQQAMTWKQAGYSPLRLAVNVSSYQLRRQNFCETVKAVLAETGCGPGCLELELTESAIMDDVEASIVTLKALKEMGVHLAIDDFGTGYSSLSQLKRFPIDSLKIDRSFILNVTSNKDDLAIVVAIIAMAQSLGLNIIAEGVETDEQRRSICAMGCHEMQGRLVSMPVPAAECLPFLNRVDAVSPISAITPLDDASALGTVDPGPC